MTDTLTVEEQEMLLNRRIEQLLTAEDRGAFAGRVCMITGAGGTVGAELARQIVSCRPALLILVDHSEHALFRLELDIREHASETPVMPALCDVTRAVVVRRLIKRLRPDIVFHAAAYKHVTMAERAICAAVHVNVFGTCAVLQAALETGAKFVLISSDKAACPRSVMGATKRFAELAVLAERGPNSRRVVVRFGNVLASSGSFVEVMRERIRAGRSIQVTNPDATRFFMSLSEAASLVMKASTTARGGETFWLDMGQPVRIGDLTDRLLRTAERRGWPAVPVEIVGLRPGEKLAEQLTTNDISMRRTEHPSIWVARQPRAATAVAARLLAPLRRAVARDDALAALKFLTAAVPDFVPSSQAWAVARSEPTITAAAQPAAVEIALHHSPLRSRPRPPMAAVVPLHRHADAG
jgi:FlaA1/EpsC-like NDP-sugar epimerase